MPQQRRLQFGDYESGASVPKLPDKCKWRLLCGPMSSQDPKKKSRKNIGLAGPQQRGFLRADGQQRSSWEKGTAAPASFNDWIQTFRDSVYRFSASLSISIRVVAPIAVVLSTVLMRN
jgi:hypothetical protein